MDGVIIERKMPSRQGNEIGRKSLNQYILYFIIISLIVVIIVSASFFIVWNKKRENPASIMVQVYNPSAEYGSSSGPVSFKTVPDLFISCWSGEAYGKRLSAMSKVFLNLPFVERPRRLLKATQIATWPGIVDATMQGKECLSNTPNLTTQSEDCLTLKIAIPDGVAVLKQRNVIIFIHGGGFVTGSAYVPIFDLFYKTAEYFDSILVMPNYRLNFLGFLPLGDINVGLHDQSMAMFWIKQNIASLGGNPNMVILQGQSAGGNAVRTHLVYKPSFGLFHRAVIQSGYDGPYCKKNLSPSQVRCFEISVQDKLADPQTVNFIASLKCNNQADTLLCIQNAGASEVAAAVAAAKIPPPPLPGYGPIWDVDEYLPLSSAPRKPIFESTMRHEGMTFMLQGLDIFSSPVANTLKDPSSYLKTYYSGPGPTLLTPIMNAFVGPNVDGPMLGYVTDLLYRCPAYNFKKIYDKLGFPASFHEVDVGPYPVFVPFSFPFAGHSFDVYMLFSIHNITLNPSFPNAVFIAPPAVQSSSDFFISLIKEFMYSQDPSTSSSLITEPGIEGPIDTTACGNLMDMYQL